MTATTQAQRLAMNPWFAIAGRAAMIVVAALISTAIFFGKGWLDQQFNEQARISAEALHQARQIGPLRERVVVLETQQARGQSDQRDFQKQVIARMDRFQDAIITLSNTVSGLTATIKAENEKRR